MNIDLEPGRYVVAVSGGVDSVVLLDLLRQKPELQLVVAHFDHGIREDSVKDRQFVASLAKQYGLPFEYAEGRLGSNASEATAREARYDFLHAVRQKQQAAALVTAHHQDDLLETALLNLLRGTNRKGLSSLRSTALIKRPLLAVPKQQLMEYARQQGLVWHEDSTNADEKYLRNYIRRRLVPRLSEEDRIQLLTIMGETRVLNDQIDGLLREQLQAGGAAEALDRAWFIRLPHNVAREILLAWLNQTDGRQFDRRQLERLVILAKTLSHGKLVDVDADFQLKVTTRKLALVPRDR